MESSFALVFLLTLLLGTVQVVFALYSRNAVQAAAYEGARSAIDRGAAERAAVRAAHNAVARTAGGLVEHLEVAVGRSPIAGGTMVTVEVIARLRPIGPLPMHLPISVTAHAVTASDPP